MNGYTAIFENEKVSFEEWVWRYARAYGPLVHMREESWDAVIRLPSNKKTGDSYYETALAEAKQSLARRQKMTLAEAQAELDEYYTKTQKEARETIAKKQALRARIEGVLQQCRDWVPPTKDHVEFKEGMINELVKTLEYDCDTSYYDKQLAQPKGTAEEWLANHIQWSKEDVERYTKRLEEELGQNKDFARKWILALQASVPTLIIKD